jgi:hypothetical protein
MANDASKHDSNGAKFNDWRLPTKDELNLAYFQKESIGGFDLSGFYWSSTENGIDNAWGQIFLYGDQFGGNKGVTCYVRAVRAF